jgi:predicted metal-dependent HD superfamily phosphohydrolase
MERGLSPELTYHNLAHTFEEVLPAALRLVELHHFEDGKADLVAVASAFHDIGRVIQGPEHEAIGAGIARTVLPRFGFSSEQIDTIAGMILATRLPQSPQTLLEEIVVDADMDALGRKDFMSRSEDLRAERVAQGSPVTDEEWLCAQLQLLESHRYHTEAARLLGDEQKKENLAELKRLLEAAVSS